MSRNRNAMIDRRNFLRSTIAGLGVGAGFASNLASLNAFAADSTDYKALVCVFLVGGMDGHDTVIPYDSESYNQFQSLREPLLANYDQQGISRRRDHLLPLRASLAGRDFAMPPQFENMHSLFEDGRAAIIGNVGPLVEPINRQTFLNETAKRPARLGSHNDQQSTWMTSRPEGAPTGWGGRFGDIMDAAQANATASFTTISTHGNAVFLNGETVHPLTVSSRGVVGIREGRNNSVYSATLQQVLRDDGNERTSLFKRDLVNIVNSSLDNSAVLRDQLALPGDPTTAFPGSRLAERLQMVAKLIARRDTLGMKRQVFYVPAFGFDTHSDQASRLSLLQTEIDTSIRAFYDSMVEMGIENSVTTFTASDFGRTLGVNGDGTDHGWGGHHLVVGGAVNGGQILGNIPPSELGHDQEYGRGRLIPQISVDQYAGALGKWFGLSESELLDAIPGYGNFDSSALSNLFA